MLTARRSALTSEAIYEAYLLRHNLNYEGTKNSYNVNDMINIIIIMVNSIIKYGVLCWGNGLDVSRVFICQKRIFETMFHI